MVVDLFLVALDLCSGWLEVLGSACYRPYNPVSSVGNPPSYLVTSIVFSLLHMFLICLDGCSARSWEFASLLVLGPPTFLCQGHLRWWYFSSIVPDNPRWQCISAQVVVGSLDPRFASVFSESCDDYCVLVDHGPCVPHFFQEWVTQYSVLIFVDGLDDTYMSFYYGLLLEVISNLRPMFIAFRTPQGTPWQEISDFIVFSLYILNGKIIPICSVNNAGYLNGYFV